MLGPKVAEQLLRVSHDTSAFHNPCAVHSLALVRCIRCRFEQPHCVAVDVGQEVPGLLSTEIHIPRLLCSLLMGLLLLLLPLQVRQIPWVAVDFVCELSDLLDLHLPAQGSTASAVLLAHFLIHLLLGVLLRYAGPGKSPSRDQEDVHDIVCVEVVFQSYVIESFRLQPRCQLHKII